MKPLNPFDLPDSGVTLLEASAGTGKTWTIVSLAVRLLIESELPIQSLLILTFTRAATGELKDRLRRRLNEARHALSGNVADPDNFMQELINRYQGQQHVLRLLDAALQQYDEASVTTIHGYCQRVLSEQAFSTGADLDLELHDDQFVVLREVVDNFWREVMSESEPVFAAYLAGKWQSPQQLLSKHEHHFRQPLHLLKPLQASSDDWLTPFVEARNRLLEMPDRIGELRKNAPTNMRSALTALLPKAMPRVVGEAKRLCRSDNPDERELGAVITEYLSSGNALLQQFSQREKALRYQLLDQCEARYNRTRSRVRALCYQDFLADLNAALASPRGPALAAELRKRFPIALVDEFQDTDPLQAAIFQSIYATQASPAAPDQCALYLVGDPKQAIYSFRGADVFAYLQTSRLASRKFALEHNWRSNAALIDATNKLFECVEEPFKYAEIPFDPVAPAERNQVVVTDGLAPDSGLTLWLVPSGLTASRVEELLAQTTAEEVQRLITEPVLIDEHGIAGRDMAILVRTHHQAGLVRRALSERGIASVSRGGASVFDTDQCAHLVQVMRAVAAPRDMALVKGALATPLFGWKAGAILELNLRPAAWQAPAKQFQELETLWRRSGVANMLMSLMRFTQLPQRLLSGPDGHRSLTNYRHLIELMDGQARTASTSHDPHNLIDWVAQQQLMADPPEERLLRLETDEDLVSVITLHASKGLEFGVVFCPFLFRQTKVERSLVAFHDPAVDNRATLQLDDATPDQLALARTEQESEAMRLAYVAMTRARYRCYAALRTPATLRSAFCPVRELLLEGLQGAKGLTDAMIEERLNTFARDSQSNWVRLEETAPRSAGVSRLQPVSAVLPDARQFRRPFNRDWGVTSFSALHHQTDLTGQGQDFDLELEPVPVDADAQVQEIPGGVRTGIVLHHLLEVIDFQWDAGEIEAYVTSELAHPGYAFLPAQAVSKLLKDVLQTSLGGPLSATRLCEISRQQRIDEMGFFFSVDDLSSRLNRALRLSYGAQTAALNTQVREGYMRGFIDLVFECNGRYYLADYKSNLLRDNRYDTEALTYAMRQMGYDVQAMIYAQALHRLLQNRLPDYNYADHFGGVYYLFLRGMIPTNPIGHGAHFQRPSVDALHAFDCRNEEL